MGTTRRGLREGRQDDGGRDGRRGGGRDRVDAIGLRARGGRAGARAGTGEAVGEDAGPREHRAERDDLEEREVDRGRDEEPGAGEQEDEHGGRRDHEALRQAVQQERRGQKERRETEDHHPGDLVMEVLVGVERNAPHEGEIDADHREEEGGRRRRAPTPGAAPESPQIAAHAHGENDDERAADLERGVEERGRQVAERAELAEVQLPPQRVARGQDRGQDAADQHDEHGAGEVHRGDLVEATGEAPRKMGEGGGRDGGTDRNAHFGHFRRGRFGRPPTPRDPQPPSAHSGLSRGNDGPRSPRRRRNPSGKW